MTDRRRREPAQAPEPAPGGAVTGPPEVDPVSGSTRVGSDRVLDVLLLLAPVLVFALLALFVLVDPPAGVTTSNGTATDEAWDVINARNLVLLGRLSTDDWNLHLVNAPFSAIQAAVFSIAGVGIGPARLVSIAAVALTMAVLGWGLRRTLGAGPALIAALAYGTSALVLFYGRLAFLEPTVALGLTVGALLAVRARGPAAGRWGVVAGLALALAIGTKPSAAFAAVGILVGLAVVGGRSPSILRWLVGAVGTIGAAAVAWLVLIGLPNRDAVATDLRIWASEPLFASPGEMLHQVLTFPIRNDGFLGFAAPIILFGVAGALVAIRRRSSLPDGWHLLLAVAIGWLVVGLGLLALAPYRPSRYEVPLLPAFALLGAIGCAVVLRGPRRWSPRVTRTAFAALCVTLVAPGLLLDATWMSGGRSSLPDIQARVRAILPAGAAVQGDLASAFALTAPVVTLVSRPSTRVNPGDLYRTRGVRWYVGTPASAPAWAALHQAAWSARTSRLCAPWGGAVVCLWQLP